jgi:outer membrane biosynthesis protein TonB
MFSSGDTVPERRFRAFPFEVPPAVRGWAGSLLLHVLFVIALFALVRHSVETPRSHAPIVPVSIVRLGNTTASPPQLVKSAVPQQIVHTEKFVHRSIPAATAPAREQTPPNALDAQLRALARLRAPQASLPVLDNAGASDVDATSDDAAPGSEATYAVRDYIRNQVERRWSLNLARLAGKNPVVLIRIEMKRNGTITKAEIVDHARFTTDAAWRDIALSARNAVLLSSPIALPSGELSAPMDFTLKLSPRDTLR